LLYISVAAVLTGMVNTPALIEGKGTKLTANSIKFLQEKGVPADVINAVQPLKDQEFPSRNAFEEHFAPLLSAEQRKQYHTLIVDSAAPPEFNQFKEAPVAFAFQQKDLPIARFLVTIGALTGMTSVLLVMMLGQPRILFAMSRDGLLPPGFFAAIHPRFRTPWKSTILTGAVVAGGASLLPLNALAGLRHLPTPFSFTV